MNFDFIKGIKELSYIYKSGNNAEELANTHPSESLVASRKGAEALAKLIYMKSHTEEMERQTFDAILKDQSVRRFIHSRDILDAFYNIKQKGNAGAHADDSIVLTPEDAIEALWDLHYVTGEIACKYGLIKDYPDFDKNIGVYPEAKALSEEDINEQVKRMYSAFEAIYKEQELENNLEQSDYRYVVEGVVDMHEYLYFDLAPNHESTKKYIQNYLSFLVNMLRNRSSSNNSELYDPVELRLVLKLNNNKYSSDNSINEILDGIEKIYLADSIEVDAFIKGNLREFYERVNESGKIIESNLVDARSVWNGSGMYEELLSKKRREKFIYKQVTVYPDAGEINCLKIDNGKDYTMEDLLSIATTEILSAQTSKKWFSWMPSIHFEFDFEKHTDQLEKLKDIVLKHMHSLQPDQTENDWIDVDDDEVTLFLPQFLNDINKLQVYLDDITELLYEFDDFEDFDYYIPIMNSAGSGYSPSATWVAEDRFAVASVNWINDELKVVGIEF